MGLGPQSGIPLLIADTSKGFKISPDGKIYYHPRTNTRAPEQRYYRLLRFGEYDAGQDTVLTIKAASAVPVSIELSHRDDWTNFMQPVYSADFRWSLWNDYVLTATTLDYQLEYRDKDGELLHLLKVETLPFEVSLSTKRLWMDEGYKDHILIKALIASDVIPVPRSMNKIPFSDYRPAIIDLAVDPLGRIWILASTEDPLTNRLDLFSWDGFYLGGSTQLGLPQSFLRDGSPIYIRSREEGLYDFIFLRILAEDL